MSVGLLLCEHTSAAFLTACGLLDKMALYNMHTIILWIHTRDTPPQLSVARWSWRSRLWAEGDAIVEAEVLWLLYVLEIVHVLGFCRDWTFWRIGVL